MANKNEDNEKISFNNTTATTRTLQGRCFSYEIFSNDGAIYVAEDEDATIGSYRIPKDVISERIIPCNSISVLGVSGAGLAEIKLIPMENWAISDQEVMDVRAPVK